MTKPFKRIAVLALALAVVLQTLPMAFAAPDAPGDTTREPYVSTVPTPQDSDLINPGYDRGMDNTVTTANGISHPGYYMSREDLNVMRDMVWLGMSPWKEAFEEMLGSPYASLDYRPSGPFATIADDRETYALDRDVTAASYLALMWYITGGRAYADKAIKLLMDWAATARADTKKDLIRNGIALQKLGLAAEILRYSPSGWTAANTEALTGLMKLLESGADRTDGFFNQGLYALSGYMAIAIFTSDRAMYEESVQRLVYNRAAVGGSGNSTNFSVAAILLDSGQIVEMGRDQPHSIDDILLLSTLAQVVYCQGTGIKLEDGVFSITPDGEDIYEFQNEKLLKAMAYISKFNLGEDVYFQPNINGVGDKAEYPSIAWDRRPFGGITAAYNHYRYVKGCGQEDERDDPYMTNADGLYKGLWGDDATYGALYRPIDEMRELMGLEGHAVDCPGFGELLHTPWYAADPDDKGSGPPMKPQGSDDVYDVYNRYPGYKFDASNQAVSEPLNDDEGVPRFVTSNVKNNTWIAYEVDFGGFGSTAENPVDSFTFAYGVNSSNGGRLTIKVGDYTPGPTTSTYNAAAQVSQSTFPNTGWYDTWRLHTAEVAVPAGADTSLLTGVKTVYLYFDNSSNVYGFNADTLWFKFHNGYGKNETKAAGAGLTSAAGYEKNADGSVTLTNGGYFGFGNFDFDNGFDALRVNMKTDGGALRLYSGDPESGGRLADTYALTDTAGEFALTDLICSAAEKLYAAHDAYFVYEGAGSLTIDTFRAVNFDKQFEPISGGSYFNVPYGAASRPDGSAGRAGLSVAADGRTRVVYYGVPFLDGPRTLTARIRSDVDAVMSFNMLNNANGNVAVFDVPVTAGLSGDGWITMRFDLKETGYDTVAGAQNMMLTLTPADGKAGTVEVDYILLSYDADEDAPEITVAPALNDLPLYPGAKVEFTVTEKNGGTVEAVTLPEGASFDGQTGRLTWNVTAANVGAGAITFAVRKANMSTYRINYVVWSSLEEIIRGAVGLYDPAVTYTAESRKLYLDTKAAVLALDPLTADYADVVAAIREFELRASQLKKYTNIITEPDGRIDYIKYRNAITFSMYSALNGGNVTDQAQIFDTIGIGNLTDGRSGTYVEIRPNGTAADWESRRASITMDFGAGMGVKLSQIQLQARQDQAGRTSGVILRGSNDGVDWVQLTPGAAGNTSLQTIEVYEQYRDTPFRYIRLVNPGVNHNNYADPNHFISMAEYYIFGEVVQNPLIPVTIDDVADSFVTLDSSAPGAAQYKLPAVVGYDISIKASDKPDVIALDGAITPPETDQIVRLTLSVRKDGQERATAPVDALVISYVLSGRAVIAGNAVVGETLAASLADTNNVGTLSYTWKNGDDETLGAGASYTVKMDDVGKKIRVEITSSTQSGAIVGEMAEAVVILNLEGTAAIDIMAPIVGDILTASLSGANTAILEYTWKIDGNTAGTGASYTVKPEDYEKVITAEIASSVRAGVKSVSTAAVNAITISGRAVVDNMAPLLGDTLTASYEGGEEVPMDFAWKIWDETVGSGLTYTVKNSDFGKTVTVEITSQKRIGRLVSEPTAPADMLDLVYHGVSVSVASSNGNPNVAYPGDIIILKFRADQTVHNVKVLINGDEVPAYSDSGIDWGTADYPVTESTPAGRVEFKVSYELAKDGDLCQPLTMTTDGSYVYVAIPAEESGLIDYVKYRDLITWSRHNDLSTGNNNNQTAIRGEVLAADLIYGEPSQSWLEYRPTGNGSRAHLTMDFGDGLGVRLNKAELQARLDQNGFPDRMPGVQVQGSNNGTAWVELTDKAVNSREVQAFTVADETAYRYIRVTNTTGTGNAAAQFLSIGAFRIYGEVVPNLTAASVAGGITAVEALTAGDTELKLPAVPEEFEISIESSSNTAVIGTDGKVVTPSERSLVEIVFRVTKGADSASTVSIPVLVPVKTVPVIRLEVGVSTPTIVETLAANLAVTVKGEGLEGLTLKAYLQVGEALLYETDIVGGKGTMRVTAAPGEGLYNLVVRASDGTAEGACVIDVTGYNTDIWSAHVYEQDGKLRVRFNEDISHKSGSFANSVRINGVIYSAAKVDDRTLEVNVDASAIRSGDPIIVSGVKYPRLFPSYSFTFTLTCP